MDDYTCSKFRYVHMKHYTWKIVNGPFLKLLYSAQNDIYLIYYSVKLNLIYIKYNVLKNVERIF